MSIKSLKKEEIKGWTDRNALLIFFSSLFIYLSIAGTRIYISDEGVILDQFVNFINGELAIKISKINTGTLIQIGDNLYGKFSYSLLFLALPVYYLMRSIDNIYGANIFLLQLWALSGGIVTYLIGKKYEFKSSEIAGVIIYILLISINLYYINPLSYSKWGEFLSLELTNILLMSLLTVVIYLLFKDFFSEKIAIFSSFFIIIATPISFHAISLKHHLLSIFLTILAIYLFNLYYRTGNKKMIYSAYFVGGLCLWTRILDGAILLIAILLIDLIYFKKHFKKYISHIFILIAVISVSLIPFLSLNYLISGNPLSILDEYPGLDKTISVPKADDFINLENNINERQIELLKETGYKWDETLRIGWSGAIGYLFFLRLGNTFGIFLVSPFLIMSLLFFINKFRDKLKINIMDKLLLLIIILFVIFYRNYVLIIITDTPLSLEYRYILIIYILLLYFIFRENKIRILVENNLRTIMLTYLASIMIASIFLIKFSFISFLDIYYSTSLLISFSMITAGLVNVLLPDKNQYHKILDGINVIIMSISIALASIFLMFFFWIENMTYVSPSQNHLLIPIMDIFIQWMMQITM